MNTLIKILLAILAVYVAIRLLPLLGLLGGALWFLAGIVASFIHLIVFALLAAVAVYLFLLLIVYLREKLAG